MKSDKQLQSDVLAELAWEPSVDAAAIGIAVEDGVVSLNGFVTTYAEKMAAERAARRVAGVKAIAEELKVRPDGVAKTADQDIAKRVIDVLHWNSQIPAETIQVKVENGWVTLTGKVDWHYQSERARIAVSNITGVTGITNLIAIAPRLSREDVHSRIKAALERQADIDAAAITVRLEGGRVTLSGKVRAPYERQAAELAAWSAPGVTHVEDKLQLA